MTGYIYQAELLCESCGEKVKKDVKKPDYPCDLEDETTFDSDDYPKGPFDIGESDCPEHCACCGLFLENPLTADGDDYVREYIENSPENPITQLWAEYYDYLTD